MPELLLFTRADIINWLDHNNPPKGLSEKVIAPQRAWAIAHNPYVKDDDPIVAAIYDNDELAAFTAAFPEIIDGKRFWWFTTLYCLPKFTGKGYGLIVVGSLAEIYGEQYILDRWGANETVKIFECLGCKTIYSKRFLFGNKLINRNTLKGRLSYSLQEISKFIHRIHNSKSHSDYSLNYLSHIDDQTYSFIKSHRCSDVFLHTKEMMNWIISYPFSQSSPLTDRVNIDTIFSSITEPCQNILVQVKTNNHIIGCYVIKFSNHALKTTYIYYDKDQQYIVFDSILEHLITHNIDSFETEDYELACFINDNYYFPKKSILNISYCQHKNCDDLTNHSFQLGDGDSFA